MNVLVHVASGIGNLVLTTPLLRALADGGFAVDLRVDADYSAAADLFRGWSVIRAVRANEFPQSLSTYDHIVPAVPPFYWQRFRRLYGYVPRVLSRPKDSLFAQDEQAYYLEFAYRLGVPSHVRPFPELPIGPSLAYGVTGGTLVLAPGCKTGEMAAKRWPWFPELAERFSDVAVVGTRDDLPSRAFPSHVRSFVDRLTLRETAELMAGSGLVVGNDTGLSHISAAVGTRTLILFGPTSDKVLGKLPPHVQVLRSGLPCEPCWTVRRLQDCNGAVDCLSRLSVARVEQVARLLLNGAPETLIPQFHTEPSCDRA